jgi:hypothetical protein
MGVAQSIPIVGEVVTVAEAGSKAIAGGAYKLFGADKASQELLDGAKRSLENYAEVNLVVSNARVIAAKIKGDDKEADHLLKRQGDAWTKVAENTPVVGHAVGIYHYIDGDTKAGNRCMIGASCTTVVMVATVATGGVAGPAVVSVAAACESMICCTCLGLLSDCSSGAGLATVPEIVEATYEKIVEVTDEKFGVREGTSPQVPHADIIQHHETANMVKIFENPGDAMSHLEPNTSYDFVRLEDGSVRYIEHTDAVATAKVLESDLRVGHTTLVPPETKVVAAGEIHVDSNGIINNINCQSGHFCVPLEFMTTQIGNQLNFPISVLTFKSPLLTRLLGSAIASNPVFKATIRHVYVYSPTFFAIHTHDDRETSTPLADSTYVLAVKETAEVKVLTFFCSENALAAYDASPSDLPRFLWDKGSGELLVASEDKQGVMDQCRANALSINKVFPGGSWRAACQDIETWWDETLGKYEMRCTHAGANGADFTDEIVFQMGDIVEIQNSLLVNLGKA